MSDLFHPDVLFSFVGDVWDEMICHPRHTFMILTKRPAIMKEFSEYYGSEFSAKNIWLGVTAENQRCADERIPILLQIPAAVRFVSVEPMLENIDISGYYRDCYGQGRKNVIDWVICGCESGSGARPFDESWARDLKDQCVAANVPFFYKQGRQDGKLIKMPELDGRVWDQCPEVKNV
jgi:protein gp37